MAQVYKKSEAKSRWPRWIGWPKWERLTFPLGEATFRPEPSTTEGKEPEEMPTRRSRDLDRKPAWWRSQAGSQAHRAARPLPTPLIVQRSPHNCPALSPRGQDLTSDGSCPLGGQIVAREGEEVIC